jgi:hypothetical protein
MTATILSHQRITDTLNDWNGSDFRVRDLDGRTVGMVRTTMDVGRLTVRVFDGSGTESWHADFSRANHGVWEAIVATINAALAPMLAARS